VIAQSLLDGARNTTPSVVQPATMKLFTKRAATGRALGWELLSPSGGQFLSAGTFGHTGFTGTSLWIDPELDIYVVLLTSRLNPSASNNGHIALRRALNDAAALAIMDPVPVRRAVATKR
jgi:CubicO group peptidase (beta-lactamase class C family)